MPAQLQDKKAAVKDSPPADRPPADSPTPADPADSSPSLQLVAKDDSS